MYNLRAPRNGRITRLVSVLILLVFFSPLIPATSINGIINQVIGFAAHAIPIGGGANTDFASAAPGASTFALVSNGVSADPSFQALPNAGLVNSSITITPTGCIGGGGSVALGASVTVNSTNCQPMAVVTNASPGATPTWTVANGDIWWTLSANATLTVTVAGGDTGRKVSAHVCQPAGQAYTVTWASNVKGGWGTTITANTCATQNFESFDGTNLYATGLPIINQ